MSVVLELFPVVGYIGTGLLYLSCDELYRFNMLYYKLALHPSNVVRAL